MKRTVIAAFAVFVLAAGASAEETHRYLIATKQPFRAGALAAVLRDARQGVQLRNASGFRSVDGFAADLTSSEVAELRRNPNVRFIEPVIERHTYAQALRRPDAQTIPYGIDL